MKVTAIICEYNPFHLGHKHQLDTLRDEGAEAIVCLMSGNFVQRGDAAIADKYLRARMAMEEGADLVVELPIQYACNTAERFACGGTSLLARVFPGAELAFSTESGDGVKLRQIVDNLLSEDFAKAFGHALRDRATSYPRARQATYESLYGPEPTLGHPNEILGLEYCLAIRRGALPLSVKVLPRKGAGYNDPELPVKSSAFASATSIRRRLLEGDIASAQDHMAPRVYALLAQRAAEGGLSDLRRVTSAILLKLRGFTPADMARYADINAELAFRLSSASRQATTLDELYALAATKNYTASRVRRAVLAAFLEIAPPSAPPSETLLLAASVLGCELLGQIRKTSPVKIHTKPSTHPIPADEVYGLTLQSPRPAGYMLKQKPAVEKPNFI